MAKNKLVPRNVAWVVTEIEDSIDTTQRRRGVAPPNEPRLRKKREGRVYVDESRWILASSLKHHMSPHE